MNEIDARVERSRQHLNKMLGNKMAPPPTQAAPAQAEDQPKAGKSKRARKQKTAQPVLNLQAQALLVNALASRAAFEDETGWEMLAASGLSPFNVENIYGVRLTGQDWLEIANPKPAEPEYDSDGNRIIDVDLSPAQADLLNEVLVGMSYKASKRKLTVIEATLTLTPSQRGHMGNLVKLGLVNKQNAGWVLTDKALTLYGATWKDIKQAVLQQHEAA